jgi:hypothetical protein
MKLLFYLLVLFITSCSSIIDLENKVFPKNENPFSSPFNIWELLPVENLKGYWNFNSGNADDLSGNSNNGTPANGAVLTASGYKGSYAYQFSYSTQAYISIPYALSQDAMNELTLMAWVYPTSWDNTAWHYNRIISKQPVYILRTANDGIPEFVIQTTSHGYQSVADSEKISLSNWHFIAGTFDGKILSLYVDGVLKASNGLGVTDTIQTNAASIRIGDNPALMEGFTGKIDEITVWNKAISNVLVQTLYNQ